MALIDYFRAVQGELSEDSQERLERNPLRILDSKDPRDQVFVAGAPKIDDFLSGEAQDFFGAVTSGLDAAGVSWTRAPSLVRGLDYYRHTAFEFVTDRLGAQGTVLGGGRYDGLMESLGGPATPAVGWAAGIERLAMLVFATQEAATELPQVAVIAESRGAEAIAQTICFDLRRLNVSAELYVTGSPRKRFGKALTDFPLLGLVLSDRDVLGLTQVIARTRPMGREPNYPQNSKQMALLRINQILHDRFGCKSPLTEGGEAEFNAPVR